MNWNLSGPIIILILIFLLIWWARKEADKLGKKVRKKMKEKQIKVEMGMAEQGKFTKFMKERVFPNGIVIIALMISWISGFVFRGIYR